MENNHAQLPVRVQPHEDESGLGFLLRASAENRTTLYLTRLHLSIKNWRSLCDEDISRLAHYGGCDRQWLVERLFIQSENSRQQYQLSGHPLRLNSVTPNLGARVCPKCLEEQHRCHRVWQLPGAIACPRHENLLVDSCVRCGHLISWRRPSVDVCKCGRYLALPNDTTTTSEARIAASWTRWLEFRLHSGDPEKVITAEHVPEFLSFLTIDGATALVLAFGLAKDPGTSIRPKWCVPLPVVPGHAAIERGLERLRTIEGQIHRAKLWADHVDIPILERLRRNGLTAADRECARKLLAYVTRPRDARRGGRYSSGQQELFA